jgi:ArsR family transcriptional regulator
LDQANDETLNEVFRLQAELCRSLADPKRLRVIHELREGERSVGELARSLCLKQSNTSQHLGVLRRTGLVTTRKVGSTVYYQLVDHRIAEACDLVRTIIADQLKRDQRLTGLF